MLLLWPRSAAAGSYQMVEGYPQGSGTLARTGQSTENLTDPNIETRQAYRTGETISYSYSEEFRWEWIPAEGMTLEEDPPQEVHVGLEADVTLNVSETPSIESQYISGSGSFGVGGENTSISGSGGPAPATWSQTGVGSTYLVLDIVLNGETVTFEVDYCGTLTVTDGTDGEIGFRRDLGGRYIEITSATGARPGAMATQGTISAGGAWSTVPSYQTTVNDYQIQFFERIPPTALWGDPNPTPAGPPLGAGGNWSIGTLVVPYDSSHPTHVKAKLRGKRVGSSVLTDCYPAGLCEAWRAVTWT